MDHTRIDLGFDRALYWNKDGTAFIYADEITGFRLHCEYIRLGKKDGMTFSTVKAIVRSGSSDRDFHVGFIAGGDKLVEAEVKELLTTYHEGLTRILKNHAKSGDSASYDASRYESHP